MAEAKRGGWLSRMFGGGKPEPEPPEVPLARSSQPEVQALNVLFGEPGSAAADVAEARGEPPLRVSDLPPVGRQAEAGASLPALVNQLTVHPTSAGPELPKLSPTLAPSPGLAPTSYAPEPSREIAFAGAPPLDLSGLVTPAATAHVVQLRVMVHVTDVGDVETAADTWAGERASGRTIEGLSITAVDGIDPDDLEYQGLQDDGTLTVWHRGGDYCGTRGARRSLHGCTLRLAGPATSTHRVTYAAVFVDGTEVGPLAEGTLCAAPSGAALEAIYVMVDPV